MAPYQIDFDVTGMAYQSEVPAIPAEVPGSVQQALRRAGLLPDWNEGLNTRLCEWVENRHWIFETQLPSEWFGGTEPVRLRCPALDFSGEVRLGGKVVGGFNNAHESVEFDLSALVQAGERRLQILFTCPPRWLGQSGYTSRMTDWKARFNYTWDWTPRLVQIGIVETPMLEIGPASPLDRATCWTENQDTVTIRAEEHLQASLWKDGDKLAETTFTDAVRWSGLPVECWWPNGEGEQPLYTLRVGSAAAGEREWRIGFRTTEWRPCLGAPEDAAPWLFAINDRPIFLQGVNWTPIRPNYADVTDADYRERLTRYRDLGANLLRIWGGASRERPVFYDLCDELGLLVWQEFPLCSSGIDNWPPEGPEAIDQVEGIARDYIHLLQSHCSLVLWCGGNELQGSLDGGKQGVGKPVDLAHPMIARLGETVGEVDPSRRFVPSSSSGPRFLAAREDFGKGWHWDVHGPWGEETEEYWGEDDALFRSEVGTAGASPVEIIRQSAGGLPELPVGIGNPLWRRSAWWIQAAGFVEECGREPGSLEEFVRWSQAVQARALRRAVLSCKRRFPACGGIVLWMGHDSFPCTANTSILDFHGNPKPAALAVSEVWKSPAGDCNL